MTTGRRTNPRAHKGPSLQERLAQEQAELAATQNANAPLEKEEDNPAVALGDPKEEDNTTEVEQTPRATDELEPVSFPGQREQRLPTPSDTTPQAPEQTKTSQQFDVPETVHEPVKEQEQANGKGEPLEAIPAPRFPYIVERKQLSARIDKRLIKAMQHFAIDRERNDYEVWEEAAKAFLLEHGVKWSKAGEAL